MPSKIKGQSELCCLTGNRNDFTLVAGDNAVQLTFPCFKGLLLLFIVAIQVVGTDNPLLSVIQHGINDLIHKTDL